MQTEILRYASARRILSSVSLMDKSFVCDSRVGFIKERKNAKRNCGLAESGYVNKKDVVDKRNIEETL